jgi:hypothetical protein
MSRGVCGSALELRSDWEGQGQNRTREIRPSGIAGGLAETLAMEKDRRARKVRTPKQRSLHLRLSTPHFYPDLGQSVHHLMMPPQSPGPDYHKCNKKKYSQKSVLRPTLITVWSISGKCCTIEHLRGTESEKTRDPCAPFFCHLGRLDCYFTSIEALDSYRIK